MESKGVKFGADQLGKLKMVMQCVVLIAVLFVLEMRAWSLPDDAIRTLTWIQITLIYIMLALTIASGVKYVVKAVQVWGKKS